MRIILEVFSAKNKEKGGFCQGHNFIAATLLVGIGDDVQLAFIAFAFLMEKCLPPQYYSAIRKMLGMRSEVKLNPSKLSQNVGRNFVSRNALPSCK